MSHATIPACRAALILLLATACGAPSADAHPPRPADQAGSAASASAATAAARTPAARGCPVPVCRYEGTAWAEDRVGDELVDRGEARVAWTFSHMDGREAVYRASGEVTAAWRTDRCAIALDPAAHAIPSGSPGAAHMRLHVDFTTRPVRYSAYGSSEWAGTQTWSCASDAPFTEDGVTTRWLVAEEMTSADPGLLQGTQAFATGRSGWEFRNAP